MEFIGLIMFGLTLISVILLVGFLYKHIEWKKAKKELAEKETDSRIDPNWTEVINTPYGHLTTKPYVDLVRLEVIVRDIIALNHPDLKIIAYIRTFTDWPQDVATWFYDAVVLKRTEDLRPKPINPALAETVRRIMLNGGSKLEAVKVVKNESGAWLKEAKEFVDQHWNVPTLASMSPEGPQEEVKTEERKLVDECADESEEDFMKSYYKSVEGSDDFGGKQ